MSPAILNAERVYLSRTVVDFHREGRGGGFRGPPSLLLRLMKFEAQSASRHMFEADVALRIVGMGELSLSKKKRKKSEVNR